jgi:hypothetical protein
MMITQHRKGDRVRLVHTTDPYTRMQPGELGTIARISRDGTRIDIDWDCGSALAMLLDEGDVIHTITP